MHIFPTLPLEAGLSISLEATMRAKRVWESSKKLGDKFVVSLGCNAMEKLGAGVLRHETIACIFSQMMAQMPKGVV